MTEFSRRVDRGQAEAAAERRQKTIANVLSKVAEQSAQRSGGDQTQALVAAANAYFSKVHGGASSVASDLARLASRYASEGRRDYAIGLLEQILRDMAAAGETEGRLRHLSIQQALARQYIEMGLRAKAASLQLDLLEQLETAYGKHSAALIPLVLELGENVAEMGEINSAGLYLWRASELVNNSQVLVDQVHLERMDRLRARLEGLTRQQQKF